jgi:hypothetical protein
MRLKSFNRLILDAPAQPVETLAEAERLFPVAAIWNDRLGSALVQFLAQFGAVVCLVAKHFASFTLRIRRSAIGQSCALPPVNKMARRRP